MKKETLAYYKSEVDMMASHGTIPVNREVLKELIRVYEEDKYDTRSSNN